MLPWRRPWTLCDRRLGSPLREHTIRTGSGARAEYDTSIWTAAREAWRNFASGFRSHPVMDDSHDLTIGSIPLVRTPVRSSGSARSRELVRRVAATACWGRLSWSRNSWEAIRPARCKSPMSEGPRATPNSGLSGAQESRPACRPDDQVTPGHLWHSTSGFSAPDHSRRSPTPPQR